MKKPRVSVILPTHNRAPLLREAIESVLAQTFFDWELVVVDDGSTDGTTESVRLLAEKVGRIRYLRQEKKGVSAARNRGVAEASGEWVAFLDDDDLWLPEKLEKQLAFASQHPECGFLYGRADVVDEEGQTVASTPSGSPKTTLEGLVQENTIPILTVLVRKSLIQAVGGFDESLDVAEDYDLWLRLTRETSFGFQNEQLGTYRERFRIVPETAARHYQAKARVLGKLAAVVRETPLYPTVIRRLVGQQYLSSLLFLLKGETEEARVSLKKILSYTRKAPFSGRYRLAAKALFFLAIRRWKRVSRWAIERMARRCTFMKEDHLKLKSLLSPSSLGGAKEGGRRVLYFEAGSGRGGSSASLYRLVKVLRGNGITPLLAAKQEGPNIEKIRALGIRTFLVPTFKGKWRRLLSEILFLRSLCLKEKVEIVHLNTGVVSGLSALFVAKLLKIPVVSHARGNETMFMGHLARMAARWVDEYVCVSSFVREAYGLDRFKPKEAVKTLYDGLEPEAFSIDPLVREDRRRMLRLSEKDVAVGMFARFVEGKGQDQFLYAARELLRNHGGDNVSFFLVGADGVQNENPYEKRIRDLAKELSLEKKVTFVEWQSDVKPTLSAMDMVVLPSFGEGLGLALLEAMALGKAVVATNVGGIPELIQNGKEGLLVPPQDPFLLAGAIQELIVDPTKRKNMSELARMKALTHFSIEKVAGELLGSYGRLLIEGKRGGRLQRPKRLVVEAASQVGWRTFRRFPGKSRKRSTFSILMYHRVTPAPSPYFGGVTEEIFRRQLSFLKKNFTILPLPEVVTLLSERKGLPPRTVCVTFDDGLRSVFSMAFPILSDLKLPATVFLTTGPIDRQEPIWTDLLALLVSRHTSPFLSIYGNGLIRRFPTRTTPEKRRSLLLLKEWLKQMPDHERRATLERFFQTTSFSPSEDGFMMTWDQVRILGRAGITFGAHTISHPILSRMSTPAIEMEIAESKKRIEEVTGETISLFAYPNGEEGDFDGRVINFLKKKGFVAACTALYGMNRDFENPFVLKRIPAFEESLPSLGCRLLGWK